MIRPKILYAARYFRVHETIGFVARLLRFVTLEGSMPRPKAHYSLTLKNHQTGERLKLDLVDLPFANGRNFRLRVDDRELISDNPIAT